MNDPDLLTFWIILAVATPLLALLIALAGRWMAAQTQAPLPPHLRRNCLILLLAGPANLLLWLLFNRSLDAVGSRSVIGIVAATAVFIAAGFATGFFARVSEGRKKRTPAPKE